MTGRPSWNEFLGKNPKDPRGAMEALSRMLFRTKYAIGDSLGYFKNHPGNETDTIHVGNDVIGFQSKFFDGNIGSSEANQIIHSMQEAKKNNPDQTTYIIYTNSAFGIPKTRKEDKAKGKIKKQIESQQRICDEAQKLNLKLEWMFGDNILDSVQNNELAYNVFFNNHSDLNSLNERICDVNRVYLKSIKGGICANGKDYTFSKSSQITKLQELISCKRHVIVSGEGGTGKSALVKSYFVTVQEKIPFVIVNAGQFVGNTIDELVPVGSNFTLEDTILIYADDAEKVFVIDSAEKLLDIENKTTLLLFLERMSAKGWNFVFTVRENALHELEDLLNNTAGLLTNNISLPLLEDKELKDFLTDNKISVPIDKNLYSRIHNLFYLSRYTELSASRSMSISQYRECIWNKKIKGKGFISRELQEAREQCVVELANRQFINGGYIICKDGLNTRAVASLLEDEIIGEVAHLGYTFTHDIYSDWALNFATDIKWFKSDSVEVFLQESALSRTSLNAFYKWFKESVDGNKDFVSRFLDFIFTNKAPNKIAELVLASVLSSEEYSYKFFKSYNNELQENNYYWLTKAIRCLLVYCKQIRTFIEYKGLSYPIMQPIGSGWEVVVSYVYSHYNDYKAVKGNLVVSLLKDYADYQDKDKTVFHKAGIMALNPHKEFATILLLPNEFSYIDNAVESCKLVARYSLTLINEISDIIDEVIKNKWNNHRKPYHDLISYIVKAEDLNGNLPLYVCIPKRICKLMDFCWIRRTQPEEDEGFGYSTHKEDEYAWGLSDDCKFEYNYFPPSAFKTCVFPMLGVSPDVTGDFIIRFTNKTVDAYSKSGWLNDSCYDVGLTLADGSVHKYKGNQTVWNLYRGTSGLATPYLLQSMHMALELYLLQEARQGNFDNVGKCIKSIFEKSESLSLIAIIASIVTAYPDEFFDEAIILCGNLNLLQLDLMRYSHETNATPIEFAYHRNLDMLKERKESNAMKHRKQHLETLLLNMQIAFDNSNNDTDNVKLQRVYDVVDSLKEQYNKLPKNEKGIASFVISRIDYRSMRKESVDINGIKAIQITPFLSEEQKAESKRVESESAKTLIGSKARMWAEQRFKKQYDKIKDWEYEQEPLKALILAHDISDKLKKSPQSLFMMPGDEFLPALLCATLLLDFESKLNKKQIDDCTNTVLSSLCDVNMMISSSMSSLDIVFSALAKLVNLRPSKLNQYKKIILAYVDEKFEISNIRCCDLVGSTIIDYKLWVTNKDFMLNVLHSYVKTHTANGECSELNVNDAESALCLVPVYLSIQECDRMAKVCMEKLSEMWDEDRDNHNRYGGFHGYTANIIAQYIYSMPENSLSEVLGLFGRYFHTSYHDSFLMPFILQVIVNGNYERFWKIWYTLYPYVIKNECYNDELLNNYMLCPIMYSDWGDEWFAFEEKDMAFYRNIASDIGGNRRVIKNIAHNCCHIAKAYYEKAIPIFSLIFEKNPSLDLSDSKQGVILDLEAIMRKYMSNNESMIKDDSVLRKQVERILNYMTNNESSYAAEIINDFK